MTAAAQTQVDLATQTKRVDFTAASSTKPIKTGTSLPATCAVGDMFFKTDAAAGANLYGCAAANAWSPQAGSGGGSGSLSIESNGTPVGSRSAANFIAGAGLTNVLTDTGSAVNVQFGLDTAVIETKQGEQGGTALLCASHGGSNTAYQCSLSPTSVTYSSGMVLHWLPDVNGAGGATTLNVDGLGAAPLMLPDGTTNPSASDIAAGRLYEVWYDGGVFRLFSNATAAGLQMADTLAPTATQSSASSFCLDTGTTSDYACALSPPITAYSAGTVYWFRANTANSGAATVNLNSLGSRPIKKAFNQDLAANDIQAGQWSMVTFDGVNMQMQSQTGNPPAGSSGTDSIWLDIGGYNSWTTGSTSFNWLVLNAGMQTTVGQRPVLAFGYATFNVLAERRFALPANFSNTAPLTVVLSTAPAEAGATGNIHYGAQTACPGEGSDLGSPVFNTAAFSTPAPIGGAANLQQTIAIPNVSAAGCGAGSMIYLQIFRDPVSGNSTSIDNVWSVRVDFGVR